VEAVYLHVIGGYWEGAGGIGECRSGGATSGWGEQQGTILPSLTTHIRSAHRGTRTSRGVATWCVSQPMDEGGGQINRKLRCLLGRGRQERDVSITKVEQPALIP